MAVLVIAEHHHGALSDATHKVVTAASKFGGDVDVLVAGENAAAVAPAAARIAGVRKVLKAEGESLRKQTAEAMEALVVPLMAGYDAVFIAATTTGKNIAPRIAAKLDVMQLSEIIEVVDQSTFVRPIYAGNAIMTVKSSDAKKVITVRGTAFPAAGDGGSAAVEDLAAPSGDFKSEFVSEEMVKSDRPELTAASGLSRADARSARRTSSRK
jgi:electron transfer flavoprotein alpha subunit